LADTSARDFTATICGIDELDGFHAAGVTHLMTLLDPGWPTPASLDGFAARRRLDLRFHDVIETQAGFRAPEPADVAALLAFGHGLGDTPDTHLLVHCQKGLSRSTAAVMLILAQAQPETPAAGIVAEIVRIRPRAWPNLRLVELGDERLGRRGALVAATAAIYRAQLALRPRLHDAMISMGRSRELELAARA
jgi:predicted protein tyrosine phosphatase